MDRKMEALREDGTPAPVKAHKVGLRTRILRRMKGWCNYGRSDDGQVHAAAFENPTALRAVRIRTRDLIDWKREFENAVGDVLRVATRGDAKAPGPKGKLMFKFHTGHGTFMRRSKSVCNVCDSKMKSLARSASESDLKDNRNTMVLRFLRDLMMPRAALNRAASDPNMNAIDPDAQTNRQSVSFPNVCF